MRSTTGRNTPIQDSHENTFDAPDESDPIIENLEVLLVKLREELHVCVENGGEWSARSCSATRRSRGLRQVWGKGGYSVPSIVEPKYAEIRRCTVDFVRLLEKRRPVECRLSEDGFWRRQYNCVLLTGNGSRPAGSARLGCGDRA